MFAGQVICGAVLSCTVINCVPVAMFPHASAAVHVLTITPVPLHPVRPRTLSEKLMPMLDVEVQLSVAVAIPVTSVLVLCVHAMVIAGGTVSWGVVLSMMTTV